MLFTIASLASALFFSSGAMAAPPPPPAPNHYPVFHTGTPKGTLQTLQNGMFADSQYDDMTGSEH